MDPTYLHHQTPGKPLFSDTLWNRPERRSAAGKLALIGGRAQGFNAVSLAYTAASRGGIIVIRTLLPDALKKVVSQILPESEFAPSTKSGSFSANALSEWLSLAEWADGVLICGDLGKNSETAILLERFIEKNPNYLTLIGDALDLAISSPLSLMNVNQLLIGAELSQLQKLLINIRYPMAIRSQMTLFTLADLMHTLTQHYPWAILTEHLNLFFAAYRGEVSTTPVINQSLESASSWCSVWVAQQPANPFAAISSALYAAGA